MKSGRYSADSTLTTAKKGNISSLRYLWHYIRPYSVLVGFALLALVFTSVSVLGLGYGLRYLIDDGIGAGNMDLLNDSYGLLLGIIVLLALTTYMRYYLVTWIGEKVVANIRTDMYQHLISLDVTFYESNRIGELLSRLTTDTTLIQTVVGSSVSIALRNALLLIGGLSMLIITSFSLTKYVLLIVPLVILPIIVIGKKVRVLSRQTQDRVADINVQAEETLSSIQTIQAFTLERYHAKKFDGLVEDSLKTARKRISMRAMLTAIVISLVLGAIITVLLLGGKAVIEGTISAGELSAFVFYAMVVAGATGAISEVVGDLQRAAGAVERLTELKSQHPLIKEPLAPETINPHHPDAVRFEHVVFNYPSRPDVAALSNVSFAAPKGKTTAIVGPSGGGKSTIFKLLLRYYDVSAGNIFLYNHKIQHLSLQDLRHHVGIVAQDTVIFSASAYDNIALGAVNATKDDVSKAAHRAEIGSFIESLPEQYDSYLGEKGVRLSGGQKQRIAIARALLRAPDILLLDEATSALDSENEEKVQQALAHIMKDRTTLVIAHRLSTVRSADNIIVVDAGQIVAQGTYDALLASNALFQTLAKAQFQS
jgi:ATP-binding cassette, subfamily B, bacterial